MLVLTRNLDESIRIGPDVTVTVLSVRGNKVRLGVAAPVELPVHRSEVADAIARGLGGKPVEFASRHKDELSRLRSVLHLVLARGPAHAYAPDEWARIKAAMAPPAP